MPEETNLGDQIEAVRNEQSDRSGLVKSVYDTARNTQGKFDHYRDRLNFISLTKVLGISTEEEIMPALRQAYVDGAIMKPRSGGNIDVGLPEFVDGMNELGVSDDEISDYIAETLEYRVVEGMGFGGCLECVAIPFAKNDPAKIKVKDRLHKLQRESTSISSNPNSTYKSSWEKGIAREIEELYRDHEEALYQLARINDQIDNDFDYNRVRGWKSKATVEVERWKEEIHPEKLTHQQELLEQIPYREGRDRAMQLAWLDIVLDSEYTGGAGGKGAAYSSALYSIMLKVAEAIKSPEEVITQIKTTAKERYNADL
jgi:hypothetical protein